jgi:UDP-N-acetylmuramate dehydrogenase
VTDRSKGERRIRDRAAAARLDVPFEAETLAAFAAELARTVPASELALLEREPMRRHTTLQIGGPADLLVECRTRDAVVRTLAASAKYRLPLLVLGGGSNLLCSDEGWRGVVLHLACERMDFEDEECWVEAGADFLEFIRACRERELSALEFAAGVPGSVGGAIYGNAGCYGQAIGEFLIEADVCEMDGSGRRIVPGSFFEFDYRTSRLKRQPLVLLAARIRMRSGSGELIQAEIDARLEERRIKHPAWRTEPTAGSYFKNLPPEHPGEHRVPAGRVLDQCECRGLKVGGAEVFAKHANIIINAGGATAREALTLAEIMRTRARTRFGIELEEEVLFVGPPPELLEHPELTADSAAPNDGDS